jgi:hypothetical protein
MKFILRLLLLSVSIDITQCGDRIANEYGAVVEWELTGETAVLGEYLPGCQFSTTNPAWPDLGSNPGRRSWKLAINHLSYGEAYIASKCNGKFDMWMHT